MSKKKSVSAVRELVTGAERGLPTLTVNYDDMFTNMAKRPVLEDIPEIDRKLAKLPKNDMGNAQRLATRFGKDLTHVDENGWFGWTGNCWSRETGDALAVQSAHRTVYSIRDEVIATFAEGPIEGELGDDFIKRLKSFRSFCTKSGDINRVRGLLSSAEPYMRRPRVDLDAKPLLFNVQNGTLHFAGSSDDESLPIDEDGKAGDVVQLRNHERSDLITRVSPVEYDPKADCPHFRAFMAEILPDPAVRKFIQQWFGYTLTGSVKEERIVMFYGGGSNGKSVLMNLISYIMGDYALTLPFASLLKDDSKRGADASPDLARLPGARFVMAAEPEQGAQFSESMIKQVTGADKMTVRQLHKEFFEFYPQFKLILSFNNRPQIRGQDHGIWRRILLVPFEQMYVEEHQLEEFPDAKVKDKGLPARLRSEAAGILNWMLDGYRMYAETGLEVPDIVKVATDEYRQDSNPVGQFLADCTERYAEGQVSATHLYDAYKNWCVQYAQQPWSQRTFGQRLTDLQIKKQKSVGSIYYKGLRLTEQAETELNAQYSKRSSHNAGASHE